MYQLASRGMKTDMGVSSILKLELMGNSNSRIGIGSNSGIGIAYLKKWNWI